MISRYLNLFLWSSENLALRYKTVLKISIDTFLVFISFIFATFLRLEDVSFIFEFEFVLSFFILLSATFLIFWSAGLYSLFIRHVSLDAALIIAISSVVSALTLLLIIFLLADAIPWTVSVIYGALLFAFLSVSRFTLRTLQNVLNAHKRHFLAVYGAGSAGIQLLKSIKSDPKYRVRLIIDDDKTLQGQKLFGTGIVSFERALKLMAKYRISTVLLAIPSATTEQRQKIITKLNDSSINVKSIPSIADLVDGTAEITEVKNVFIDDLLGREIVKPIPELLAKNISGMSVLVTGAGGSIGSELCRQIVTLNPKRLIVLDLSELGIYTLLEDLNKKTTGLDLKIIPVIGSVEDRKLIKSSLGKYKVDTVYHAAAYKHVPLMEQNVITAIKNNTLGTLIVAEESARSKVTNFTLVSTDKAVNPTNVMGATKRLAEHFCLAMNNEETPTCFSIVRFGNVLGSSGSVIPLFKRQIAEGGPVTLSHTDVERYFMTISEAVQLIVQASSLAEGGDVFVLDMGHPVKIKDLAIKMIQLSGCRAVMKGQRAKATNEILIKVTGLRPGEKMYEELAYGDVLSKTKHPKIMRVTEIAKPKKAMDSLAREITSYIADQNAPELLETLKKEANYQPVEKTETLIGYNSLD